VYYVNNLPAWQWDADNDGLPDWRDPSQWPQFGMSAFKIFSLQLEPNTDPERYATLAGYNFQTGVYEPFDTIPPSPDDQRFLMSSGPFDLAPDSVATLVFAVMFANWNNIYQTPDSALALVDKWAQRFYDLYWFTYTGTQENSEFRIEDCGLKIGPSPASTRATATYSVENLTDVSLKLYNTAGQLVREIENRRLSAGIHSTNIDIHDLPLGMYFLVLETPTDRQSRSFVIVR
jgi:hypothetical protein